MKDTSEYRCLQSQFSVLYNESLILKAQLDETRSRLNTTRTARLRQLEHMDVSVISHLAFWQKLLRELCIFYQCLFIIFPSVCRTMRWPCRGRFVQKCFSLRTLWLRSGKSMKCSASNLNRLSLPTNKQVNKRFWPIVHGLLQI